GPGDTFSTALPWAVNLSGHPAASVPAGVTGDGCPVGVHLVAARGRDAELLGAAGAAERALSGPGVPFAHVREPRGCVRVLRAARLPG
ncbi:amidase family protein, partial [Streptomyces sp. DT225]